MSASDLKGSMIPVVGVDRAPRADRPNLRSRVSTYLSTGRDAVGSCTSRGYVGGPDDGGGGRLDGGFQVSDDTTSGSAQKERSPGRDEGGRGRIDEGFQDSDDTTSGSAQKARSPEHALFAAYTTPKICTLPDLRHAKNACLSVRHAADRYCE